MIHVSQLSGNEYEVKVKTDRETIHRVHLSEAFRQRLGGGDAVELIKQSFEFLLEREHNTSILPKFDLTVISNYFPEYETEITKRLQS